MLSAELVRCVLIWLQPTAPLRLVPVQDSFEIENGILWRWRAKYVSLSLQIIQF
jgi:hypothetical protein